MQGPSDAVLLDLLEPNERVQKHAVAAGVSAFFIR